MGQGEELLRVEPAMMKIVHFMSQENNWHIRRLNAQCMAEFVKEMHHTKQMFTR
jgi:bacterioferritin (cytochrome b1)